MKATLVAAMLLLSVPAATREQAQPVAESRPDFSGTWGLTGSPRNAPWSPFGSRFTLTQTGDSLSFDVVVVHIMDEGGPASVATEERQPRMTLKLNGETRVVFPRSERPPFAGEIFSVPVEITARVG